MWGASWYHLMEGCPTLHQSKPGRVGHPSIMKVVFFPQNLRIVVMYQNHFLGLESCGYEP